MKHGSKGFRTCTSHLDYRSLLCFSTQGHSQHDIIWYSSVHLYSLCDSFKEQKDYGIKQYISFSGPYEELMYNLGLKPKAIVIYVVKDLLASLH